MLLPRIRNGVPLVVSNTPALSDDPCTCCDSTPCFGCNFPLEMTCSITGFDPVGGDCTNLINSPKAQCGGWNTVVTLLRDTFSASNGCHAKYTGVKLYNPCEVNPANPEKNIAATAVFTFDPNTNTHTYSLAADAGRWHGEISNAGIAGCPHFGYAFALEDTGSICIGSPIATFS